MTARARMSQARIALEAGHAGAASALFEAQLSPLRNAGRVGQPLVAQALVGYGEALLAQGQPALAVAPLREALALRETLLSAQSWELAITRVRLGEALKLSQSPGAAELLNQGLAVLQTQLGETHPQVLRAQRTIAKVG